MSANNVGDRGAVALAEMLKSNGTLASLDVSSNNIDYDGITALSAALADNSTLRALYIRRAPAPAPGRPPRRRTCKQVDRSGTRSNLSCEICSVAAQQVLDAFVV